MSNTYLSTVANLLGTLIHEGQRIAQSKLAPLSAFGHILPTEEPLRAGLDAEIPLVTAAPATQVLARTDTPNYLADGTVTSPITVTPKLFVQPITVTNANYQSGNRLAYAARFAMNQLANAIWDNVAANLTTANFGAAAATVAAGSWTQGDFSTLASSVDGENVAVVLDKTYSKRTPNIWLPAAGNCTVYEANRWASAGTNVTGFAATPEAFAFTWQKPETSVAERRVVAKEFIVIPQLGNIEIEASVAFATDTRTMIAAYRVFFGAAPADKTNALKLLTSA